MSANLALDRARIMAEMSLERAVNIIQAHCGGLLYQVTIPSKYGDSMIYSFHFPGIIRVHNARTGELRAESAAGQFERLNPDFIPPFFFFR